MIKNIIKGNNPRTLLAFNLVLFALVLLSPWMVSYSTGWVLVAAAMYFSTICLGISVTFHRALTHRAVKLHWLVERVFATLASFAGTGSPIMWVMTHRQHHRYSDKAGDPHPPSGVLKTFFGIYPRVSSRGIRDIARVRYYAFLHRYYFAVLGAVGILLALLSYQLFFFVFALPIFLAIVASNTLNWYGHTKGLLGYRNYSLSDNSQNNALYGVLIFGEGWHNNHHRHPGSARFGLRWFEIDVSFWVIKALEKLNLATNVKEARL